MKRHVDWHIRQTLMMQFLFNATAFYYNTPVFYRVSQINQNAYFAEPTDSTMRSFELKKFAGTWTAEGGYTDFQALQIGEQIDKLCQNALKN